MTYLDTKHFGYSGSFGTTSKKSVIKSLSVSLQLWLVAFQYTCQLIQEYLITDTETEQ